MSDIIHLLPDSVANQIAAGEVIQRPASVIKELVENAIDARATEVQIILKDAGRTLIQIIDNGIGMTDTDARLAFERHSTSKIRSADDLFSLTTMGFRGEALASIAAISQVELRTKTHDAQLGTHLIINASTCQLQEPVACPSGSNFMIKNLFFNVPARRKFLKSNQVELSNIVKEFEKLALINNNVAFTLTHNDRVMYKLSAGTFLQRITAMVGKHLEPQLIPVQVDTSLVKITGYVGKPEAARRRGAQQFFFANERFMRHPYFHKAILTCYDQIIAPDTQPVYFLRFNVEPETIDVNIHPTKTEIKFENEQPIWQILAAAVKEALGRFANLPAIDFDATDVPAIPPYDPNRQVSQPPAHGDKPYNPFNQQADRRQREHIPSDWQQLYENFLSPDGKNIGQPQPEQQTILPTEENPMQSTASVYLQINARYIATHARSGLMLFDQHRAHLQVLYNQYQRQITSNSISAQALLFPEELQLTPAQSAIFEQMLPEVRQIGFSVNEESAGHWLVTTVPTGLEGVNIIQLLTNVIDELGGTEISLRERILELITLRVASSAAIPYGRILSQEEMAHLVEQLLQLPRPNYTPDGKLVINVISTEQIAKMF